MLERIKRNVFTAPLLVIVIGALATLVGKLLEAISYESAEALFLSYIVAELLVFVLPGIFYVKLKPRGYAVNMNLVSFGFSKLPSVILMFFVMVFGSVLTNLLLSNGTLAELSKDALQMTGGDYLTSPLSILYVSLALAVVPAFAEEFIFRGILLNEYKNYGMLPSVCISAFLFAMLHFDLRLFPLYFLSGLALGFTAYVTRSALSAAVLHALYNLFSLFFLPLVLNFISMEAGVLVFYLAAVLFLLFLMLTLGEGERLFAGYASSGIHSPEKPKRKSNFFPAALELFSPTLLLSVVLFLLCALKILPV